MARAARRWRAPLVLALALAAPFCLAQTEEEQARARLEKLQEQIEALNRDLSSARSEREKLLAALRDAELALGQLQREMHETRERIGAAESELAQLEERRAGLEARRDEQRAHIARELEMAWKLGRQEQLKILLNQEQPHTLARTMHYYDYFFEARRERIDAFRATLAELEDVRAGLEQTRGELEQRQQQLRAQQNALEDRQREQHEAAERLAQSIASKGDALAQLERDREELEQLLEAIQQAVIDMQLPENVQAFTEARGRMPWPIAGEPDNRFGHVRNEGGMRWQGINIPAEAGTTVRAIHHGRVVYADWFRGSGLLVIIDHGDGYMSLYAHNQSLLREVGEWVRAGTPLGTVGESGGRERPALYFEIRHNGKPVDPARWCGG